MSIELTKESKIRWLSRIYFSVSDSPNHDVNPHDDVKAFLKSKVSAMDWGKDAATKRNAKLRFTSKFEKILELYEIAIPSDVILSSLNSDKSLNSQVIEKWAEVAVFPER